MRNTYRPIHVSWLLSATLCASAYGSDSNYVVTNTYYDVAGSTPGSYSAVTYYDGLGRPYLTVDEGMSTSGQCATYIELDCDGNAVRQWLPVPAPGMDPVSVTDIQASASQFYGDSRALTETGYDALGRVISSLGPGQAWQDAGKSATKDYLVNQANTVKQYVMTSSGDVTQQGYWVAGTLRCERTVNEDGLSFEVYTDYLGRTVLVRRGIDNDTYYVYNSKGQLSMVLTPGYQYETSSSLWAYKYTYDSWGNISKRVSPGGAEEQFWHDRAGRLTFSRDGYMTQDRQYAYDNIGRLCLQMSTTASSHVRGGTAVAANFTGLSSDTRFHGYSSAGLSSCTFEKTLYYDDYAFIDYLESTGLDDAAAALRHNSTSASAVGLQTGCAKLCSDGQIVWEAYYYDEKARVVETKTVGLEGRQSSGEIAYTHDGLPCQNTAAVVTDGVSSSISVSRDLVRGHVDSYDIALSRGTAHRTRTDAASVNYDEVGRKVRCVYSSGPIINYGYNPRGWLTSISSKYFSERLRYESDAPTPMWSGTPSAQEWKNWLGLWRRFAFSYDELGRLSGAYYSQGNNFNICVNNYSEIIGSYAANGMPLRIERLGRTNGTNYGIIDDLELTYVGDRLKSVSDYSSEVIDSDSHDFYDGADLTTEYEYYPTGALKSDANKGIANIEYDRWGNLRNVTFAGGNRIGYVYTCDGEKLRTLHYTSSPLNSLSLPEFLSDPFNTNQTVRTDTTDYVGCFVLVNGQIERCAFNDGYVDCSSTGNPAAGNICFYLLDHVGSVRAVVGENNQLLQEQHYYPSGMIMAGIGSGHALQPVKFSGKELDRMHGLEWHDFGARPYDAALMQWPTPDPLRFKKPHLSQYCFCANNPIAILDPDGKDEWFFNEQGKIIEHKINKKADILHIVDSDGKVLDGKSLTLKKGTVISYNTNRTAKDPENGNIVPYDQFVIRGDHNSKTAFEFLAKNTKVEWSWAKTGIAGDKGLNFFTTSHRTDEENGLPWLLRTQIVYGYTLREITHSHPNKDAKYPSGLLKVNNIGDIGFAKTVERVFKSKVTFKIYVPSDDIYLNYSGSSKKEDFPDFPKDY